MTQYHLSSIANTNNTKQALVNAILTKLKTYRHRHSTRKTLKELPDYLLDDMGISRHEAIKESQKPFWIK
ncbi:DUF1127 domain-containing protein [Reinekea thalattae]|uniref:DUF1127 domain-containing protein n=1 Tax=Reinekea thalattae TaxID=2593301 RepID=A0A5C8ZBK6_9GAMM|nr:DUF1127 domain-containing protein [Reinekea thalattae]TXR54276.1 DUF1127 domain-containing protein [Reinekea thalattae]